MRRSCAGGCGRRRGALGGMALGAGCCAGPLQHHLTEERVCSGGTTKPCNCARAKALASRGMGECTITSTFPVKMGRLAIFAVFGWEVRKHSKEDVLRTHQTGAEATV